MQEQSEQRFSDAHRFSKAAIEDAVGVVSTEHRSKRLLMNVTMGHRALALRQSTITMALGASTMLALYVSERVEGTVSGSTLKTWAAATVGNIAVRTLLNVQVFSRPEPSTVAQSLSIRLLPVIIALLAAGQWIWTIELFVGPHLGLPTFILFTGLIGTSVAMMGMWPSVPIAVGFYLVAAWPPFFHRLYFMDWLPGPVLLVMFCGVALMLWSCVYLQIRQVRTILDRSDTVDLLVADLHRANAGLISANEQLNTMRSAAASELLSRTMFFSGASHDFKQRLHAMKVLSNSAIANLPTESAAAPSLKKVADAVADVEKYVNNVLDFARFDGTAVIPERRRLELQQLFQRLDLSFEHVASDYGVDLIFRPTGAVLSTDAAMLSRILENLIYNAIKFSRGRVLVAARRRDRGLVVEIWDRGLGISNDDMEIVFSPFRQAASNTNGPRGIGLGLAVVKRFSECLGYEIAVRSIVGRGTVFRVIVPPTDLASWEDFYETHVD